MADNRSSKGKWIVAAILFLLALAINASIYYKVMHYGP